MPYTVGGTPCRRLRRAVPPFLPIGRHSVSPNGHSYIGLYFFHLVFCVNFLYLTTIYNLLFIYFIILIYIFNKYINYNLIYLTLYNKNDGEMAKNDIPMRRCSHRDFFVITKRIKTTFQICIIVMIRCFLPCL